MRWSQPGGRFVGKPLTSIGRLSLSPSADDYLPPALYKTHLFRLTLSEEDPALASTIETYMSHRDPLLTPFRRQYVPGATSAIRPELGRTWGY